MKNKLRTITAFILLVALMITFVPVAHATSVGDLTPDDENDETNASESSNATDTSAPPDETTSVTEEPFLEEETLAVEEETTPIEETHPVDESLATEETTPVEETVPEDETIAAEVPADESASAPIEVTEPDIVGETVVLFAAPRAGSTITVVEKHSFGIGHVDFSFHQNVDGDYYPVGSLWTESACYFTLSNGATAFCVQPSKLAADGDFTDSTWSYLVDTEAQIGVARAMAYGAPNNGDTSADAIKATALLIADIACGYRKADGTIRNRDALGNTMYPPFYKNSWGAMAQKYNEILEMMKNHDKIPSFAAPAEGLISAANTILLNYNSSTGLFEASVTDTNEILADYNFTSDISGLTFTRSGNTLKITATAAAAAQLGSGKNFFTRGHYYDVDESAALIWSSSKDSSAQQITTLPGKVDPVPAYIRLTLPTGNLSITKTTEDVKNLAGWKFEIYSDAACKNKIAGPHESTSSGKISVTGLTAGTVWVKEIGHKDASINALYRCDSKNPQQVTITSGQTASVSFYNKLNVGHVKLIKTTNTGKNLNGWKIGLYYDQTCTKPVAGSPFTTGADGTVTVSNLNPGTLYAKEVASSDPYWVSDTAVKKVTVTSNQTASVTFSNTHYGALQIKKTAVNGSAEGWSFQLLDANKNLITTLKTGSDGYATSGLLLPGTYYVREVQDRDTTYWTYDATVEKQVTVTAGAQAQVGYTNTQYGHMEFRKTTNTGNHLSGWTFRVTDSKGNLVGDYVTNATGYAVTGKLTPGRYYVQELSNNDPYWACDLATRTVDVTAGKTVGNTWNNTEHGKGLFRKTTNTGKDLDGWYITVYSDANCTKTVTTVTTGADGSVSCYLVPGVYYAKETGDSKGRFGSAYWVADTSVKKFEIKHHEETAVSFSNTQYGKIQVVKTMDTDGPLAGWQFVITDSTGKAITGSPFTSKADGTILTGNLLPGQYTVREIIPEGSLYYCKSDNPQTINVAAGQTGMVKFTNALRPGKITIQKTDMYDNNLQGAKFLLEWSEDNVTWKPVFYSDKADVVKGGCSNAAVDNGTLVTPASGQIEWGNLYPSLYYRVTELEAPEGFILLKDAAFEGALAIDDLEVSLRVVNATQFTLPATGSKSLALMPIGMLLCAAVCMGGWIILRKKEVN